MKSVCVVALYTVCMLVLLSCWPGEIPVHLLVIYKVIKDNSIFYISLNLHLDVILDNDQLDALFLMYLFHATTCFEQQVLIIRRAKLH
jgi:hypothetical protein